jgi:hypothetical protein
MHHLLEKNETRTMTAGNTSADLAVQEKRQRAKEVRPSVR